MKVRRSLATVAVLAFAGTLVAAAPVGATEARTNVGMSDDGPATATPASSEQVVLVINADETGARTVSTTRIDQPCEEEAARTGQELDCIVTYTAGVGETRFISAADATGLGIEPSDVGLLACKTWWQEKKGQVPAPLPGNWSERHTGKFCYTGSTVSHNSHACNKGSHGFDVDVIIDACYHERPSAAKLWEWDYFRVKGRLNIVHFVMRMIADRNGKIEYRWCNDCP